jgi:large subunit ribosomal protein L25
MAEITLIAEPGRTPGSAASRRLRSGGRIPGVVYGHGLTATPVSVDARDLRHALSGQAGLNQLLSLNVGSDTHLAMARSLQRHPVRHTVIHVDFQVVRRDEVIAADVPVVMIGEAKAVEQEKGIVEQVLTSLTVKATPDRIPSHLEVDISGLRLGEGVRVVDLTLPPNVTTDVNPDEIVVTASISRAAVELEAAEAEAAEAEAPEAGGAPAGGGEAAATSGGEPSDGAGGEG